MVAYTRCRSSPKAVVNDMTSLSERSVGSGISTVISTAVPPFAWIVPFRKHLGFFFSKSKNKLTKKIQLGTLAIVDDDMPAEGYHESSVDLHL